MFLEKIWPKFPYIIGEVPRDHSVTDDGMISWYNCGSIEYDWFHQFFKDNIKNPKQYNFFSVFGSKMFCLRHRFPHSIFFSGETVHTHKILEYRDLLLDRVDLSMSFDKIDAPNYIRFPNWMPNMFAPIVDKDYIKRRIDEINAARNKQTYEAVLIASHDKHKTRTTIYNGVKDILDIKCAGRWNNNTTDLWDKYSNDKRAYVNEFKFNICPENRNVKDYVTEKIFEAFSAGAIPIYYGSNNEPEPGIINQNAVLFWDVKHKNNNEEVRARIRELNSNSKLYAEFIEQEKLTSYAVDYVYDTFVQLKKKLNEI